MKAATMPTPFVSAKPEGLRGIQIVPASIGCFYPPAIESPDLLQVDFDCRHFDGDGLYLVEAVEHGDVTWRGARRFQRKPSGLHIDLSGEREYQRIESVESVGLRIVGQVLEVYRPARRIADLAGARQ